MNPSNFVERFYDEVWNRRDKDTAHEICAESLQFRGSMGDEITGLAGFLDYVDSIHSSLSKYRCEIEELIAESQKVFARVRFSGRHTGQFLGYGPTDKMLSWVGAAVFHFSNEKIHYIWVLGDLYGLHKQLSDAD